MLYVLTSGAGALLGWASSPAGLPKAPPSSVVVQLDAWDAPPALPYVWSPVHRDWVIPPPPAPPRMTAGDFARRIGLARDSALQSLLHRADVDAATKGDISALLAWLQRVIVTGVDVSDPITQYGAAAIGQLLEVYAPELIPQGREAFVASLLVPPAP